MNNEALDFDQVANTTRYRSRLENLFHHAFDVMGLRRNLKEVTFMADFCTAITESLNCDDVLVAAARRFYDYVPFTLIVFSDLPEMRGRTTAFFPGETAKHADCVKKFIESFPGLELENIKDYVSLGFSSSRYSGMKGRPTILELPANGGKITLLSETDVKSQFSGAVMNRILENFSLAWQNAVKYEKVKEDSLRDSLTGLYNRRVLEEMLVLEDRKRGVNPLSLLLIDLDNFKAINDTYGHPAGDLALQCAARVLSDNARGSDLVVRNGGEEFAVMLPAASASVALQVGERLRKGIENKIVEYNGVRIPLTASLGIAHRPGKEHFPANELIVQADEALYQAKKSGKNRVCFYSSSPVIIGKSAEAGKRVKG